MQAKTPISHSDARGFTLLEVVIAIAISLLIISAVLGFFWMQRSSADLQQDVAAVQQDLRGLSQILASNIRMAGYNPQHQEDFAACGGAAFAPGFQGNDAGQPAIQFNNQACNQAENVATDAAHIAFVADIDGNGQINRDTAPPVPPALPPPLEQIAYRFNPDPAACPGSLSGCIEQYFPGANPPWQPVAQNIDGVQFLYRLNNGADVLNPTQTQLNDIRAVTVTILARAAFRKQGFTDKTIYRPASCPADPDTPCPEAFNSGNPWEDSYLRQMLTFTAQCRNM